jgi:uncharacterized RDD family membrane protein YckC
MQSQYGSPSLAAPALECVGIGRRVVNLDGSAISWGESIVRNLLRIVDHLHYAIRYLLGAILIWTSPTKRRLRNCVTHTVVFSRCYGTTKLKKRDQTTTA